MSKRPEVRIIYNPRNRPKLFIGDYVYVDPTIIDYDELINKPSINGVELNHNLPITAFGFDPNDYAANFSMWVDDKYDLNITLYNTNGEELVSKALDIPIESVVVNAEYDAKTDEIILHLQNGNTVRVNIRDVVHGLVPDTRTVAELPLRADISVQDLKNKLGIGGMGKFVGGENPIGSVVHVLGGSTPDGYIPCDGGEYSIARYNELAVYIAEEFGAVDFFGGDGITTFATPDFRETPVGGGEGDAAYCTWFIKYARSVVEATIGDLDIEEVGPNISDAINNLHQTDLLMQKVIESMQQTDSSLADEIDALKKADESIREDITSVEGNIEDIQDDIKAMKEVEGTMQEDIEELKNSSGGQGMIIYKNTRHKIGKWMDYDLYEQTVYMWNPATAYGETMDAVIGQLPYNAKLVNIKGGIHVTRYDPWGSGIDYWMAIPSPLQYGNGVFLTVQFSGGTNPGVIHLRTQYESQLSISFITVSFEYIIG